MFLSVQQRGDPYRTGSYDSTALKRKILKFFPDGFKITLSRFYGEIHYEFVSGPNIYQHALCPEIASEYGPKTVKADKWEHFVLEHCGFLYELGLLNPFVDNMVRKFFKI